MVINVQANEIEMTDALHQYAEDKITSLTKFFENIIQADVTIGKRTEHHKNGAFYYAEVNIFLPNKKMVRVEKEAEDLYKAIDKVKDHLKVELEKIKEKMRNKDREEIRDQKEYHLE